MYANVQHFIIIALHGRLRQGTLAEFICKDCFKSGHGQAKNLHAKRPYTKISVWNSEGGGGGGGGCGRG